MGVRGPARLRLRQTSARTDSGVAQVYRALLAGPPDTIALRCVGRQQHPAPGERQTIGRVAAKRRPAICDCGYQSGSFIRQQADRIAEHPALSISKRTHPYIFYKEWDRAG